MLRIAGKYNMIILAYFGILLCYSFSSKFLFVFPMEALLFYIGKSIPSCSLALSSSAQFYLSKFCMSNQKTKQ